MIEMSVDKETVLSCEGKTDPPSHQPSELSGNDTSVLHSPEKSTHTDLGKEDGKEAGSEASRADAERIAGNRAVSESCLLEAEFSTQTQNGTPQSKQQSQRLSKRRTTMSAGFKYPGYGKRRRRANSESSSVLPTNFLLGGNIFDPLNLNSLLDEEVNRALNAETPKSSPLPAKNRDPVEILIPRDITDPLNLNCPSTGDRSLLVSPLKSGGRRRHRNKHHGAGGGGRGLGESMVSQSDFSETNGRSAAQADGAASLSNAHESGAAVDSLDTETLKDDRTLLSSASEAQASDKHNLTTNGDDVQDKRGSVPPTNDASAAPPPSLNPAHPSSNRQRKRKRASSRMDSDSSYGEGSSGSKSGRSSQTFHATGMGPASGSADRPNPNHCRSQYNNNQQQQRKKFQYGNYNKYYGYRNPGLSEDPRIRVFKPEWFQGKAVLDLGCNTGHLTLSIAKNWRPARIAGLDIDGSLIHAARQNIRHYLSEVHTQQARRLGENGEREEKKDVAKDKSKRKENNGEKCAVKDEHLDMQVKEKKRSGAENESTDDDRGGESGKMEDGECVGLPDEKNSFPVSLRISRGPIAAPPLPETSAKSLPPGDFPANITFVKGNYVLESDSLLLTQREEYDVIMCLSVTKWVHLNWGDAGLKRLFHRVYRHLRPGGLFILEPQPWNSYSKRKKLTEDICKNYHGIRLRPDQFSSFLTTEVGFTSYELIGMPQNLSRGFQRPIYLFHKGPSFQK